MKQLRQIGTIVSQLSYDVFLITLVGYLCALAVESMKAGTVVRYFNLNNVLIVVAIAGIVAIVLPHPDVPTQRSGWYVGGLLLLSLLTGLFVYSVTANMGMWSYLTAMACALLLYSAGIMIQTEN